MAKDKKAASGKKKWGAKGGKTRDGSTTKRVDIDKDLHAKMCSEIIKMKLITVASVSNAFSVSGSVARSMMKHLESEDKIKKIVDHAMIPLYTKVDVSKEATAGNTMDLGSEGITATA